MPERIFGWNCRCADNIETVESCRLHDAALETSRLRTGDFKTLLVPDLDRGKVSKRIVDGLWLEVFDQILGDRRYREGGVEQFPVSKRAEADCFGVVLRVRRGIVDARCGGRAGRCTGWRWWDRSMRRSFLSLWCIAFLSSRTSAGLLTGRRFWTVNRDWRERPLLSPGNVDILKSQARQQDAGRCSSISSL